jgi:hypothetical protein
MGLTNKREEQLRKMPLIESFISKSKDGRYIIQRTIITNIKPSAYYKAVLEGHDDGQQEIHQFFIKQGEELIA